MSLMHNIRNFAEHKLQGVIPWSKFSFPDTVKTDVANVSIEGKRGLYRIIVSSSYAVPPLGHVKFTDNTSGHAIEGNNQDDTWHQIAEYLKASETGEALTVSTDDPRNAAIVAQPLAVKAPVVAIPVNELPIPPVAFVWYIADPGVWYQNGPALITRINQDGSYNLTIFPDGSEPFYREKVREKSDGLRNVCWVAYRGPIIAAGDVSDDDIASMEQPSAISYVSDQSAEVAELKTAVAELQDTISRLKASAFDQRKSA